MAATAVENGLILRMSGEILGPGSPYEERQIALRKQWEPIVEAAKALKVTDHESCEKATQAGRILQASAKEVEGFYKPVKAEIDALKKPVLASEKQDLDAINAEKSRLGSEITRWNAEQQLIREAEERKAREAAEAAAREEALNRAIELELSGNNEAAQEVLEEPVVAPVVIQAAAPPKVAGQVGRVNYSMEVTNLMDLVKAVAAGKVPLMAITANESWLNGRARNDKEAYDIPGTKLRKTSATSFRS